MSDLTSLSPHVRSSAMPEGKFKNIYLASPFFVVRYRSIFFKKVLGFLKYISNNKEFYGKCSVTLTAVIRLTSVVNLVIKNQEIQKRVWHTVRMKYHEILKIN